LFDPDHAFHRRAHDWWLANKTDGWASCPLTENGAIRIMSNPNYRLNIRFTTADLTGKFQQFARQTDHEFWPDDISFCDGKSFMMEYLHSSRLLTDFYLLGLAVKNNGRLVTFDRGIPLSAVSNAKAENLFVV